MVFSRGKTRIRLTASACRTSNRPPKITRIMARLGADMPAVSITEAKNQLPRIVQQAEAGEAVHITRHGKPVAVLLSEAEYGRLRAGQIGVRSSWDAVRQWREAQGPFDWPGLTDEEVDAWRDRSPTREFAWDE
jgi:prevent-host-death family protein